MFRANFLRIQDYIVSTMWGSLIWRPSVAGREVNAIGGGGSLWRRLITQYQFKTKKECYYPDRRAEMIRSNAASRQALTVKSIQHRGLPKDFYYKVLGVNKHASVQQIRSAFYALAKRYHPDSTHSEQKLKHFQELSNAYNILTDETKRLEYDQLGGIKDEQAFLAQAGNPLFNDLTIRTFDKSPKHKKDDIKSLTGCEFDLPLTFVEATVGCKKRVDLRYLRKCNECKGKSQSMANREAGREPCRRCNGTGKVTTKTVTYTTVNTCGQCKGKRYINRNECETCDNRGYIVCHVAVLINVPAGSKTGDVIPIENPNTNQRVKYTLQVPYSDYFRRVGNDIHTDKYLNISDAILGGTFSVRGLYETLQIRVEAGTQSHTDVVLQSKGVRTRDGVGDHIITLKVRIPRDLSMKQRQLVLALAQAEDPVYDYNREIIDKKTV